MLWHSVLIAALTLASSAHADRIKVSGEIFFFVDPAGNDDRDCRSEAAPCRTMQTAYARARRDYDFTGAHCNIKLSDGVHTEGLAMTGTLVGTHLCHVIGNLENREAVIVQPPPGSPAFNIQDLAMISVMDLTVQGDSIIGFYGRQLVVVDIARVKFGPMPNGMAVSMVDQAGANLVGDFSIEGDMVGFLSANSMSRINVATGASIDVKRPVDIRYFVMSYQSSLVEFNAGVTLKEAELVKGQQFLASWGGIVNTNGLALPGSVPGITQFGGHVY
jgi:hypothetical protein